MSEKMLEHRGLLRPFNEDFIGGWHVDNRIRIKRTLVYICTNKTKKKEKKRNIRWGFRSVCKYRSIVRHLML